MTRDELMQIGHDAGFDTSELTGEVIALLECVAEHAEAKERAARIEAQQRLADALHAENEALRAKIAESRTPLTTDQKLRIALDCNMRVRTGSGAIKFAAAIEAAHGINP